MRRTEDAHPEKAAVAIDRLTDPFAKIRDAAEASGLPKPTVQHLMERLERNYLPVTLETDVEERDAYGRLLAYVYVDGRMVNARLVAEGAAEAFPFPPNTRHRTLFARLQRDATAAGRGQWGRAEGGPPWGAP